MKIAARSFKKGGSFPFNTISTKLLALGQGCSPIKEN
jgi:hypothetical protein